MSKTNWDDFAPVDPAVQPAKPTNWGEFTPVAKSGAARKLADTGLALGQGVVQGAQMLTNIAGADNAVSRTLGTAAQKLASVESPERRAEKQARAQKVDAAEKSGSLFNEISANLGGFAEAPIDTTVNALGTSLPTLAAAALTGGGSVAAQLGARVLPGLIGGAQGVGAVKGAIYDTVKNKLTGQGMTEAEADARASEAQAYGGDNAAQLALGGGLGVLAGSTGIERAATRLMGKAAVPGREATQATTMDLAKAAGVGALKEAPIEGLQGGQERVASNIALQNEGFDTPTFEGAIGQGVLEATASAPLGGGFGVAERLARNPAASAPAAPPAPPVAPAGPAAPAPFVNPPSLSGGTPASLLAGQGGGLMGAADPLRAVVKPSEAMGIDPSAGPLSRVAAASVDSGVTDQTAMDEARAAAIEADPVDPAKEALPDPDAPMLAAIESYNEDMQGMASPSMVSSRFGITVERAAELLAKIEANPTPSADELFPRPAEVPQAAEQPPEAATPAAIDEPTANVQDPAPAPQPEAAAPEAPAVEAPAPAGGDGAATAGVPDAGRADAAAPAVDAPANDRLPPISADKRPAEPPSAPQDRQAPTAITKAELDKLQVPDMTDDQLRAGLTLYGAVTRRANTIRKEIQKRELDAQSPAPQPQEPSNETQEADARPDVPDEAGQEADEEGVLSDGAQAPETQQAAPKRQEEAAPAATSDSVTAKEPASDAPAPAPAPKPAPEPKRGTIGMKLSAGEVVLDQFGNKTTPFPKVSLDTNRKAQNTVRAVDRWLIQNALSAAQKRGDRFNERQFQAVNNLNITQSDKDSAEEYLFGDQAPAVVPSILKPLVPAASPAPEAEPTRDTVVNVPATVSEAMTGQMQKQKSRIARLKREAEANGMTLDEKKQAQTKVMAAETTLRKMRTSVFDAEDAAVKAVANKDASAFAEHADLFPDADAAIKGLLEAQAPAPAPASNSQARTWNNSTPAQRRDLLRAAGYTDADQARALSGTDWNQLTDPVRRALSAAQAPAPAPSPASAPVVSANTVFTADAAEKARARLKAKLGRLNSGVDPEMLMDGITLAGYHIEKGARTFAAFARAMVDDLGDGVKPFLKSWYMGVKYDPRAAVFDGMDGAGVVEAADVDALTTAALEEPAEQADTGDESNGNATQQLDSPSTGALAGAQAPDVRAPGESGDAGAGPDGSGRSDGGSNAGTDDSGSDPGRGVGGDTGAVPVPGRGTRADAKNAKKPRVSRAPRTDAGDGQPGAAGGLTPDTGANPAPNAPQIPAPQPAAQDFTITDELALGEGGQKTKFKNNVAAIRLMQELESTGRMATPDEQAVLAKYVGWGGLPQAFDANKADWAKEYAEITALMSPEDLAAARKSTRYAHYTSREIVVDGIYAALRHFGFTGGKTLEAGAGVGNFIGLMPADMRSAGRFTAIEREPFSSAIARQLYPQQSVQRADFTEFKGNDAYFDAAVGNPPFAADPQTDLSGRKHLSGLSLHNYFFAKAVDMLREGGVMAQVVTNSFMDAKGDKARKYLSDRVELLGAIRLPNSAFAKNANTEVTTDLIFFKKRPDSEVGGKAARDDAKRWLNTGIYTDANGKQVALNQYFIDNPSMMLGEFGAFGTMYGPDQPALVARVGQDTLAMLKEAVGKLPAGVYKSIADTGTDNLVSAAVVALKNPSVKEGGYFVEGGKLMQRLPDIAGEARGVEVTAETQWTAKTTLGDAGFERIKALAEMRSTVRGLLAAEMSDNAASMKMLRGVLNAQYDAYRDTHGLINDPGTLRVFDDDPDFPLLASLEHGYTPGIGLAAAKRMGVKPAKSTAKKGPIFTQRVVAARQAVQKVDTPADALAVSMAERGRLDAAYIGQLLGMEPDEVLRELSTGDKPLLFRDPLTDEYVLRDAYLSGNVRAKLVQAKQAGMFVNVNALEAVQPEDVASHEIVARLGSPWVPTDVYRDFAQVLYGEDAKVSVFYLPANSSYQVSISNGNSVAMSNTWGTPSYPGDALLQAVMNNRSIKVTYTDADKKTRTDVPATEAANEKAAEIKARFNDWIFSDPDRSEVLTKAYNETNNNYVTRVYDGSSMTFPGKVPDSIIKFRRHQRNAIARIVQDRTGLLDHVVGAGKTFTVISGAMELKRTGLARKPMVAVPNHLVKQWAADFYRLYPGANVLTATKKDFEKANRRKFLARIATGDWDAVVIAHSSFGFIRPAPEFEAEFNAREITKIMKTIEAVEESDGDKQVKKRTVKQLEAMKERLENRIRALRDKPMDDLLDFEQIGVDQLFVDEAHMFKNLMYSTKMQGVAGLNDPTGSQRAYDMYVKTNQVMEKNGRGQGVVFATGTPVSNSLAEMYHMMRYLMPNQMRELGFESFDAWANTYASVEQVWMQAPSGDGFKAQNRMSNFVNTPELLKMFDQVSDTVTMDDIKKAYAEENDGAEFPLPKLKGGRRTPVSLEKSEAQNAYMDEIAKRAKLIEARKGPPQKGDDNILVVMSDARKAAMDIRLVDPDVTTREPGGRIDRSTDEVVERYKKYDSVKGTQLVFSDLGTPLKHAKKELAEYEALQARVLAGSEDVAASATLGNEAAMGIMEDAEAAQAELDAMGADWLSAVKAAMRGFSIYDDFKAALIEKGVPEAEIAFIHDYNTDDQKASLFRKVNAGQIRVLLGSTAKLGAGTNVQERLVALHHLDVPWRPSDVEQREGRIERQGNRLMTEWPNFEIEIQAYVTRDTLDMRMWQVQETKLKMINQLRTRKIGREIDNAFEDMELSAGEMQAAATGDINLLKEIQLRNDVKKLEQRRRSFDGQRNDLMSRKRRNADAVRDLPKRLEAAAVEAEFAEKYRSDLYANRPPFAMNIDGKDFTDAKEAQAVLRELDEKTEEIKALNGEVTTKKAPLSVTINGELIKNRATMAELFADARGDVDPIAWEFSGETYRRRTVLANGIRSRVQNAIADESVQQLGTIGAYDVAVEGSTGRDNAPLLEVTMRRDGNVVLSNTIGTGADSAGVPARVIQVVENLMSSAVNEADYLERSLARARKEAAELAKVEVAGEWPDQGKLDAARAAHKEILATLKQKDDAAAPATPAADTAFLRVDATDPAGDTAANESATSQEAAANIRVLERAIARNSDGTRAAGEVRPYDARVLPNDEGLREIAAAFGSTLQGFGLRPGLLAAQVEQYGFFNGVRTGGIVFVAAKGNTRPHLAILGHELGHELRTRRPDLYDRLVEAIRPYVDQKKYADEFLKSAVAKNAGGLDKQREEFIGEVLSDGFMDRDFWRALGNKNPSLLRQIGGMLMNLVEKVLKNVGYTRKTEKYLTDYKAVMTIAGEVMAEFGVKRGALGVTAFNAKDAGQNDTAFNAKDTAARSIAGVMNNVREASLPAGYIVNDFMQSNGKVSWWHKSVGTMYDLAQREPLFRPVFETAQKFLSDVSFYATQAADMAPTILPKLETLKDITKSPLAAKDAKAIATPIFEGTLVWGRDPVTRKPIQMEELEARAAKMSTDEKAQEMLRQRALDPAVMRMWQGLPEDQYNANINTRYKNQMLKSGIVFTPAELQSLFGLDERQAGLYAEFRAATDKSLTDMAVADMVRFGGKDLAPVADVVLEAKSLEDAAKVARDYLVSMAEADPQRNKVLTDSAARILDKAANARDLMDRGYAPLSRFGKYSVDVVDPAGERLYFGLFESQSEANKMVRQMRDNYPDATIASGTMSAEAYKVFAGVTPETLELFGEMLGLESTGDEAKDKAFQEYLKLAKNQRSAMKRLIHRKGIAGFSEDPGRVLAGFIYSNSRQISTSLNLGNLKASLQEIPKGEGELADVAAKLTDYVSNPIEEAQAIRGLLFAQYLGGSVASAMLNALQPVQVTIPWLSQYGGPVRAASRMSRAMKDVLSKAKLEDGLAAAIKKAEEQGIVSPQEVFQLQAQAAGRASLSGGDGTRMGDASAAASNALSRLTLAWGKLFGAAEQFNRRATFIAAYRTAQDQRINDPAAFAAKAIYETQFVYTKANKPQWARGAIGATVFTFKTYSISYVELMHRLYTRGGPEGKRAALLGIGVLVLMSGVGGLPFIEDVEDVIDGFMQRVMNRNFSSKQAREQFFTDLLTEDGAALVMRGFSGLPGSPVDVSGRLGLGNLIPGTGIFQKKDDYGRDLLEIVGPAGDFGKRILEAAGKTAQGEVFGLRGALMTLSPVAARNLGIAYDMANTGSYQDQRGRKVIDTTGSEAAFKAIGFQPSSVDKVQDATFREQRMISLNKIRETEIADKWARGVYLQEPEVVQDARAEMAQWNSDNPESPIRINLRQISQRVNNMKLDKTERIAKTAPKELRAALRERLEASR